MDYVEILLERMRIAIFHEEGEKFARNCIVLVRETSYPSQEASISMESLLPGWHFQVVDARKTLSTASVQHG